MDGNWSIFGSSSMLKRLENASLKRNSSGSRKTSTQKSRDGSRSASMNLSVISDARIRVRVVFSLVTVERIRKQMQDD